MKEDQVLKIAIILMNQSTKKMPVSNYYIVTTM